MSHYNPGYDIQSKNQSGQIERYIEVKSCSGQWTELGVNVTSAQFKKAQELGNLYWLYVVESPLSDNPQITCIQNPANRVKEFRYDNGWRDLAEEK
jgi:hypothetical protein